jgi:hypothetical protein
LAGLHTQQVVLLVERVHGVKRRRVRGGRRLKGRPEQIEVLVERRALVVVYDRLGDGERASASMALRPIVRGLGTIIGAGI